MASFWERRKEEREEEEGGVRQFHSEHFWSL